MKGVCQEKTPPVPAASEVFIARQPPAYLSVRQRGSCRSCSIPALARAHRPLTYSNPYGGGVLCSIIADALFTVRNMITKLGVGVAVGLARGMIREVSDVTGHNYVGHALNRAARLAYRLRCANYFQARKFFECLSLSGDPE
jgi:hypothetical protein